MNPGKQQVFSWGDELSSSVPSSGTSGERKSKTAAATPAKTHKATPKPAPISYKTQFNGCPGADPYLPEPAFRVGKHSQLQFLLYGQQSFAAISAAVDPRRAHGAELAQR